MLTYPDENSFNAEQESQFLKEKAESEREIELIAIVDGVITGTAGIEAIGTKYKVRHRAEFGISVAKKYWGLGIGKALLASCIECAKAAGYSQLELNVVAENERAVSMYEQAGFVEFGRNPKGFCSRIAGFQGGHFYEIRIVMIERFISCLLFGCGCVIIMIFPKRS